MADIRLAKPAAGASESVQCAPEARFVFDFPTTDATLARDGDNLNIRFEDGSNLELQGFYQQYNEENLPSFNIDGTEVAAADFFAAMNEPDLMPAAGPGTGTVANGARFHEWGDSALTGGITHLNGLDWGFSRSFEWDDVPNAVGYGDDWGWQGAAANAEPVNHPVTLTPENPQSVPPGTVVPPDGPENPTPGTPGNPGNSDIVPPGDVRVVNEADLRDGGEASVRGAMLINAPDGLASIEIAGKVIWQNGHMVGNPEFRPHTEGYFHDFAYDAASGRLTYTYTLTSSTQEHGPQGPDHIAHSLPVTVRDVDGDSASSHITIVIRDDVPEAVDDHGSAVEGHKITGNVVTDNDTYGADDAGTFGDGRAVHWDAPAGAERYEDTGEKGGYYQFELVDGEKHYGTVRLYDNGDYELDATECSGDWESGLQSFSTDHPIGYTIVDADGDIAHAELTLDVLKSVPSVKPGPDPDPDPDPTPDLDPEKYVRVGKIVMDEGDNPEGHAADMRHTVGDGTGSFLVNLNGETGTILIGTENNHYQINVTDTDNVAEIGPEEITQVGALVVNGIRVQITGASYNAETEDWTVSYSYTFVEAQDHRATGGLTTGPKDIPITVTDNSGGDQAFGRLTVELHDDLPTLEMNYDIEGKETITACAPGEAGAPPDTSSGTWDWSYGADKELVGSDGDPTPRSFTVEVNDQAAERFVPPATENGEARIVGANCDLILKGDGTFYAIAKGEGSSEQPDTFTFTITDADGDTVVRTITVVNNPVTITPGEDPDPHDPDDPDMHLQPSDLYVREEDLGNGASDKGVLKIKAEDGVDTVKIGGKTVVKNGELAADEDLTLNATQDGVDGRLVITGFDAATGELSYTFTLNEATREHGSKEGWDEHLDFTYDVKVTDTNGTSNAAQITVVVKDDVPLLESVSVDTDEGVEYIADSAATITGTLDELQFGADADGATVEVTVNNGTNNYTFTGTVTVGEDGAKTVTFDKEGFRVDPDTGAFTYTRPTEDLNNSESETYTVSVKVTDADNDFVAREASVRTNVTNASGEPVSPEIEGDEVRVDESKLVAAGTQGKGSQGGDGSATYEGRFTVDTHKEGGTLVFSIGGEVKETITLDADNSASADGTSFDTGHGTFTITNMANGVVSYTYTLKNADDEEGKDRNVHSDAETIDVKVIDAVGGEEASAAIKVTIVDDVPSIDENITFAKTLDNYDSSDNNTYIADTETEITGKLENLDYGADADGATVTLSVTVTNDDGQSKTYETTYTVEVVDGKATLGGKTGYAGLELKPDNTFSFTRPTDEVSDYENTDGVSDYKNETYTFTATVTDNDKDVAFATGVIHTTQTPTAEVEAIKLHESMLPDGSQQGKDNGATTTQEGTFTFDTHGEEGGTLTFEWGDQTIAYDIDANNTGTFSSAGSSPTLTYDEKHNPTITNGKVTFTITGVKNGEVSYTAKLTDAETGEYINNGLNEVPKDPIKMTVTDGVNHDFIEKDIKLTVVDDAPEKLLQPAYVPDTELVHTETVENAAGSKMIMDFTTTTTSSTRPYEVLACLGYRDHTKDNDWFAFGPSTSSTENPSFIKWTTTDVNITSSFVHYQYAYVDTGDDADTGDGADTGKQLVATNVVDLNNGIFKSGKSLHFDKENGLSVGGVNSSTHQDAWNGTEAGEISIGSGTLYMAKGEDTGKTYANGKPIYDVDKRGTLVDEYGGEEKDYNELCGTNVSEAIVFDLGETVAFGMRITLGMFDEGDRVMLTFIVAPKNTDVNPIVCTKVLDKADGDTQDVMVPDGFTKVFVSALPKGTYEIDEGSNGLSVTAKGEVDERTSGFSIKEVEFLKTVYTATGKVQAVSADGISYDWDWSAFTGNDDTEMDVRIHGNPAGDYRVDCVKNKETGVWTANLYDEEGNKQFHPLFTAWVDKDGIWQVDQIYEFEMINQDIQNPFQIKAWDGDGDEVKDAIRVNIEFNRFHEVLSGKVNPSNVEVDDWDDILVGAKGANTLMYGKGGDDVLIADGLKTADLSAGLPENLKSVLDELQQDANEGTQIGSSTDRNDGLFTKFSELTPDEKEDLGVLLEALEDKDHAGNDALYGGMGNDFLVAGAGNDLIDGAGNKSEGNDGDVVYAGSGNDIIFYSSKATYINGGSGTDILIGDEESLQGIMAKQEDFDGDEEALQKFLDKQADFAQKVNKVEVVLSSKDPARSLQITSHESLLTIYGIALGEHQVRLNDELWERTGENTWQGKDDTDAAGLTLKNIGDTSGDSYWGVWLVSENELNDEPTKRPDPQPWPEQPDDPDPTSLDTFALYEAEEPLFTNSDAIDGEGAAVPVAYAAKRAAVSDGGEEAQGDHIIGTGVGEILYGTAGNDLIDGTAGDDFIDGAGGRDIIFADAGDDLIVYDHTDYFIDGGTGLDFLLSDGKGTQHTLADMIENWQNRHDDGHDDKMPMVNDVEVMLKGVDTTSLQNMDALAEKYGFRIDGDRLILGDQWREVKDLANDTTTTYENGAGVTLETTLTEIKSGGEEAGDQAAQQIVLTNNG